MAERTEVVVVGAGQAGLSIGRLLAEQGRDSVILEREAHLAHPWRSGRWDSFTLVSPNWSLRLPGFPYQGDDPDGFMPRAGVVRYLEEYAASFAAPVRFNTAVTAVTANPAGKGFRVETSAGPIDADQVVVATGMFQQPKQPIAPSALPASIVQLHSGEYRNPQALPPGAVLVAGTAQSGCQIAEELYLSGRQVYLCVSSAGRVPRRYRGKDIFWWLDETGFFGQPYDDAPPPKSRFAGNPHLSGKGRRAHAQPAPVRAGRGAAAGPRAGGGRRHAAPGAEPARRPGEGRRLRGQGDGDDRRLHRQDRPRGAAGGRRAGPCGMATPVSRSRSSIWPRRGSRPSSGPPATAATTPGCGSRSSTADGYPIQQRGVSAVPGLYFLGMHWLHTRKSGLFAGVGDDARHVAAAIAAQLDGRPDEARERDQA